ncbi:hypothetical protein NFI96_007057, partial [Prochilodus magdalenae]
CSLTDRGQTLSITAHRGGSVLLPCSCTELRAKPETFTWNRYNQNRNRYERIPIENGQNRNRVQLVNDHSPGNLSLLISHLTEEDGRDYMCDVGKSEQTYIRLTVEGTPSLPPSQSEPFIYAAVGGLLLLMVLTGIICWRYRAQRQRAVESCESKSEGRRDQEIQDDSLVLYATVNEDTCKKPQEVGFHPAFFRRIMLAHIQYANGFPGMSAPDNTSLSCLATRFITIQDKLGRQPLQPTSVQDLQAQLHCGQRYLKWTPYGTCMPSQPISSYIQ